MATVRIKVEYYLERWVNYHFGNPVQLQKDSPEARILKRFLDKPPASPVADDGNLEIEIPFFKEKDPRTYNYLSPSARMALASSFENLMLLNLWGEVGSIENANCSLPVLIRAWCEKHGLLKYPDCAATISDIREAEEFNDRVIECLRQKFYRMKRRFKKDNINIV